MKLKCIGNRKNQIEAGVEPFAEAEVEINLSELDPDLRALIAEGYTPAIVIADVESARAALQAECERRKAQAEEKAARVAANKAKLLEQFRNATPTAQVGSQTVSGVVVEWQYMKMPYCYYYGDDPEINAAQDDYTRRKAELAARNEVAKAEAYAAKAPEIEAAEAAIQERGAKEKAAEAAALAAKCERRKEIGAVEINISRGGRDWGTPWGAVVTVERGKDRYNFDAADYDLSTETLTIRCQPGDVIAWGQKNFSKPKKTIHERRKVRDDWAMITP